MAITDGEYRLGPDHGRLVLRTGRAGLAARAGHDLTLEATGWHATVHIDAVQPSASAVRAEVEVDSLEVREGTGGVKPLTDGDRAEIKKTLRQKILDAAQHPTITFASRSVSGTEEAFEVEGELTIKGVTQPVTVRGQVTGDRLSATATVVQSRWGIKPHSAFFGALTLRDEVEVLIEATLTTTG